MENDVKTILECSQDYPFEAKVEPLLAQWKKAKTPFLEKLNGNTIAMAEERFEFKLSEKEKKNKFLNFIKELVDEGLLTDDLEQFLKENSEGFFDNTVIKSYRDIQPGQKISRTFRKFILDKKKIRQAQDIASKYMQEDKVSGYLFLSVDPRDFLTLSENNNNWWSCHSLDGDFRSGNLSYMVDGVTLVAYLAEDKKVPLKCGIEWYDKKWRMLIHATDKCRYYDRQYPFSCDQALAEIAGIANEVLGLKQGDVYRFGYRKIINADGTKLTLPHNHINCCGRSFDMRDIVDTSDYLGYSDLVNSSFYSPVCSYDQKLVEFYVMHNWNLTLEQEYKEVKNIFGMKIGARPICVCCGLEKISRKNSFLCDTCIAEYDADEDFFLHCADCGRRIWSNDEAHWRKKQAYCKRCFKYYVDEKGNESWPKVQLQKPI